MGTDAEAHRQTLGGTQKNPVEEGKEGLWEQRGQGHPGKMQSQLTQAHGGSQRLNCQPEN